MAAFQDDGSCSFSCAAAEILTKEFGGFVDDETGEELSQPMEIVMAADIVAAQDALWATAEQRWEASDDPRKMLMWLGPLRASVPEPGWFTFPWLGLLYVSQVPLIGDEIVRDGGLLIEEAVAQIRACLLGQIPRWRLALTAEALEAFQEPLDLWDVRVGGLSVRQDALRTALDGILSPTDYHPVIDTADMAARTLALREDSSRWGRPWSRHMARLAQLTRRMLGPMRNAFEAHEPAAYAAWLDAAIAESR
jgi:hypothetical protein